MSRRRHSARRQEPPVRRPVPSAVFLFVVVALGAGVFALWSGFRLLEDRRTAVAASWEALEPLLVERYEFAQELVWEMEKRDEAPEARAGLQQAVTRWNSAAVRYYAVLAANEMEKALNDVYEAVEERPAILQSVAFTQVQRQVEETQEPLLLARRNYNHALDRYNASQRRLPTSLIAAAAEFERVYGSFDVQPVVLDPERREYLRTVAEEGD